MRHLSLCLLAFVALVVLKSGQLLAFVPTNVMDINNHEVQEDNSHRLEGVITVNNMDRFKSTCTCSGQGETTAVCAPMKVKIKKDREAEGLSVEEVRSLYGSPQDVPFAFVSQSHLACLDDRVSEPSICTPGGDMGEFLLALSVYSQSVPGSLTLDQEKVDSYFSQYLQSLPPGRKFYHCTSDSAVAHLEKQLELEGLDIVYPSDSTREDVMGVIDQPENVGDTHLRLMLKNHKWYHIDQNLTGLLLKSFYSVLWDKNNPLREKLLLDVLPGKSNPKAFLEISEGDSCRDAKMAPRLTPRLNSKGPEGKKVSVLISHLDAVSARRHELAEFFTSHVATHGKVPPSQLFDRMQRHGWQWLETTGGSIAKGQPFYRLSFV